MKKLQERVQRFAQKNNLESPPEYRILDVISEVGEVAKELLKATNYGKQSPPKVAPDTLKNELGDLFYSLIMVANYFSIDLDETLALVLEKYIQRLQKGSAGSESDK